MTTEGFIASIDTMSFSAKAATVGLNLLKTAGNMLVMWGISEGIQIISACATASNRLRESAKELGSQFSSTQSDISSYKFKIEELYGTINDNTSSYEDTYNARKNLLSIQDEMIEKFGKEAEAVGLITDAINGQTDALDLLTEKEWQEMINSFNSNAGKDFLDKVGDGLANLLGGYSDNFDRMINEMEN